MNDDPWDLEHLDVSDYSKEELESYIRRLETENAALRSLVQHWYKLVPENICSSIENAQKEAKPSA